MPSLVLLSLSLSKWKTKEKNHEGFLGTVWKIKSEKKKKKSLWLTLVLLPPKVPHKNCLNQHPKEWNGCAKSYLLKGRAGTAGFTQRSSAAVWGPHSSARAFAIKKTLNQLKDRALGFDVFIIAPKSLRPCVSANERIKVSEREINKRMALLLEIVKKLPKFALIFQASFKSWYFRP